MGKLRLEKSIENSVNNYYKKKLFEYLGVKQKLISPLKLNTLGRRSWPDRAYFGPYERVLLIEFKKLGRKPTPLQAELHRLLRTLGTNVRLIDNVEDGKREIDYLFRRGI